MQIRKGYRRLYCSSVQAMLNQTAVNDSKSESFPLDFKGPLTDLLKPLLRKFYSHVIPSFSV